jgi:hypothetical protein
MLRVAAHVDVQRQCGIPRLVASLLCGVTKRTLGR